MAANIQSVLGDEVILPHDLLPDDTTLIYDKNGNPVKEMDYDDSDDDYMADLKDINRYKVLVLAYYNGIHQTDYKFVAVTRLERSFSLNSRSIHFGFKAAPSTTVECKSTAKQFCAKLQAEDWSKGEEVVTCCCIVEGPKTCKDCYRSMCCEEDDSSDTESEDEDTLPPLSQYSHNLADGVTLSDKAKHRVPFILLALAYYNKKHHADYKLVDGLPYCYSFESCYGWLYHCNFIARQQNAAAAKSSDAPASNRLFFAELKKNRDGEWVVTACRVVRGKTTAGCHVCPSHRGRRVIHPTRGFLYGLYPERCNSPRRCRLRRQ